MYPFICEICHGKLKNSDSSHADYTGVYHGVCAVCYEDPANQQRVSEIDEHVDEINECSRVIYE